MKKLMLLAALGLGLSVSAQAAMTWVWDSTAGSSSIRNTITNSMNGAIANYGGKSSGTIHVVYNSGVPTAQTAGYHGQISFGTQYTTRAAQHEIAHWNGCGTYSTWNSKRSGNTWIGTNGVAKIHSYDGASAVLSADSLHFWPYGLNYESEWTSTTASRNPGIVGAMRKDMGLSGW